MKFSVFKIHWNFIWLAELRIYVALAVLQPYRDLEAADNEYLKFKRRGWESNPGPLPLQAKSLTTRPPPLPYWNFNIMGLLHHYFWLNLVFAFLASLFNLLNYFVWLRITDEGSVHEMRTCSILLIKSDSKWCIHLTRSLFLNSYQNRCATRNSLVWFLKDIVKSVSLKGNIILVKFNLLHKPFLYYAKLYYMKSVFLQNLNPL